VDLRDGGYFGVKFGDWSASFSAMGGDLRKPLRRWFVKSQNAAFEHEPKQSF